VIIPRGKTELARAAFRSETLVVVSEAEQAVEVPGGGEAAPVQLGQAGTRGALEASSISRSTRGTPLYSGSVTWGPWRASDGREACRRAGIRERAPRRR